MDEQNKKGGARLDTISASELRRARFPKYPTAMEVYGLARETAEHVTETAETVMDAIQDAADGLSDYIAQWVARYAEDATARDREISRNLAGIWAQLRLLQGSLRRIETQARERTKVRDLPPWDTSDVSHQDAALGLQDATEQTPELPENKEGMGT